MPMEVEKKKPVYRYRFHIDRVGVFLREFSYGLTTFQGTCQRAEHRIFVRINKTVKQKEGLTRERNIYK
jgi:hypothetical protein